MPTTSKPVQPQTPRQVMPRVNGKPFRCGCGCNVFSGVRPLVYECNSCRATYAGEK